MNLLRDILGRACAAYYFLRSRGGVRGASFILTHTSLVRVKRPGAILVGRNTLIGPAARLVALDNLEIGNNVFIGKNVTLVAHAPLRIGNHTLLGENVSIHTENHGPAGNRLEFSAAPITIGDGVWIGAGVVVTAGARIGDGATIGANAVVLGDIPGGATAVGVPARVVRVDRDEDVAQK